MNVLCGKCKVTNRVSDDRPADATPVCGKCKAPLVIEAPGYPVTITDGNFSSKVLKSSVPVLLDLWGPSCPPCRQLAPVLKELAKDLAGRVKVGKLNVEENQQAPGRFQIRGIPTLIVLKNGKEVARTSGFQPLAALRTFVEGAILV